MNQQTQGCDERAYMRRAIELAQRGIPWTSPNPLVGAVIVKDGRIIGEGYHARCGDLHAERNALANCTEDPRGATIYVTLEPCCHHGRTPPCTQALIERGIGRVVVGSRDPNPKVAGGGIRTLRDAGIAVEEDFMREECDAFNTIFFHYITTKTPYTALKYAMTADGKIATVTGASRWITNEDARRHVHTLRSRYRAILVGIDTAIADDPMLNCRIDGGRNPIRIVCDSKLRISESAHLCATARDIPTIVACAAPDAEKRRVLENMGVEVLVLRGADGRVDLRALVEELGRREIDSLLIEGGSAIHYSALHAGIVQRIYAYIGAKAFGGAEAKSPVGGAGTERVEDAFALCAPKITPFGSDVLLTYDVKA